MFPTPPICGTIAVQWEDVEADFSRVSAQRSCHGTVDAGAHCTETPRSMHLNAGHFGGCRAGGSGWAAPWTDLSILLPLPWLPWVLWRHFSRENAVTSVLLSCAVGVQTVICREGDRGWAGYTQAVGQEWAGPLLFAAEKEGGKALLPS